MKNYFFPLFLIVYAGFLISGCNQKITFEGTVYNRALSPVSGATIKEKIYPEKTTSDAAGKYNLTIEVPAVVGYPTAKSYTIEATFRGTTGSNDVMARPGETVFVKDIVISTSTP